MWRPRWLPLILALPLLASACRGRDQPPGEIRAERRSAASVEASIRSQRLAERALLARADPPAAGPARQILFGDLHVHTTYSIDAFVFALPFFAGEGTHPPADACDFARHCSALDFFSLNDHAEGLTPERWEATKRSLRDCDARAGDAANPDLVVFAGWEWTQVGATPDRHYGHRNVIFRDLADEALPARPITALPDQIFARAPSPWVLRGLQTIAPFGLQGYADFLWWIERLAGLPNCAHGVHSRELPADCRENAQSPRELFRKLDEWGLESIVIPHGLAWGLHAPPGAGIENQLAAGQHDPRRQLLLEIFSGHGNGEEFRGWRRPAGDPELADECPAPSEDRLPCCWQAGEIVRGRCGDLSAEDCEERVDEARRLALRAGVAPHLVLPDTRAEDWLDCDQCRDCFKPAFALRPGETAQYSLAVTAPRDASGGGPSRFRWGFVASSDNHQGRPGTGYKQYARRSMTDARGVRTRSHDWLSRSAILGRQSDPRRAQPAERGPRSFRGLLDTERVASFMYPGGLVAAHTSGRQRAAIWDALRRREVYGTSGPRILLWFDLRNGPGGSHPMGSEVALSDNPRFVVRAVGAFIQRPGCPEEARAGLAEDRLERLCRGECYHPSDARHPISAIEVVRIRPQLSPDEPIGGLIEDPWRSFPCPPDPAGCRVEFTDPEFAASGRDAVYYVRALQEPTPAINGATLRTSFDSRGQARSVEPCHGNYRTPFEDDCLAPVQERAWSSPIFVDRARQTRR